MQRKELLNLSAELGYQLMISGAEIYRVEDSAARLLRAYGAPEAEVFAIPNCIILSVTGEDGEPMSCIRRIPPHGTDIDQLERCNELCRRLCRETPPASIARAHIEELKRKRRSYQFCGELLGYFLGTAAFCLFFQGNLPSAAISGLCGVAIGLCQRLMGRLGSNAFFKTIAAGAVAAGLAACISGLHPAFQVDTIIIGALMALVPGVCFTSALRDIMAGDMVSGLSKAAEGILIGVALAIGTGAGMVFARMVWGG